MIKIIIFFMLLFSFSCANEKPQPKETSQFVRKEAVKKEDSFKLSREPFDLQFQIEKTEKNQYYLVTTIDLPIKSYVISPFSQDSIYGHFDISIEKNNHLIFEQGLLEIPVSMEEFDPIIKQPVKFVRVNTTYKQPLKINNQADFETTGLIWFVLEPSCVPYDVEFKISQRSGKMEVKEIKRAISAGYKL